MLTVSNLSKSFGDRRLFSAVSFSVNPRDRIGLIGVNGSGKSTLLRLIAGGLAPDEGSVWLEPGRAIGLLPQGFADRSDATLGDVLDAAGGGLISASNALDHALAALAESSDDTALTAFDDALAAFENAGGHERLTELNSLLGKLGVGELDWSTSLPQLSGGEKTRAGLAGLLSMKPSLLLLDEPTNHLDAAALDWLETFVAGYPGAIVMVSHDRAFLDASVNRILELDPRSGRVTPYAGNYSDYLDAKQAERTNQAERFQRQQVEIAKVQRDIRAVASHAMATETATQNDYLRGRSKKVARTAAVRERKLERLLTSEEILEKPERDWRLALDFAGPPSAARDVVELTSVSIELGGRPILDGVDLHVRAGDRIVLTGPNGSGKSTLLRLITAELLPDRGAVRVGSGVRIGLHAQAQQTVDLATSAVEQARAISQLSETDVRTYLHKYLFSGDLALAPAGTLSYGERARLAFALLVIRGANLLLLDEPFNHLDLDSREQFETALQRFEGMSVVVLHDRRAIERIATRTLTIENGRLVDDVRDYSGVRPPKTASSKYLNQQSTS